MKDKENVAIYPFDSEFLPALRHQNLMDKYSISNVLSPNGWGGIDKDAGNVNGINDIGITIKNNFDEALSQCSTIIFTDSTRELDFEKYVYPKMIEAAKNSKKIICTRHLSEEVKKELKNLCEIKNSVLECYPKNSKIIPPASEILYDINVPVIFILGIAENTNKFEIQLALRENLLKEHYKVSQIGSKHYCELFGFHSFPDFMYHKSLHEHEKITLFNHFIKNIELKEKPDLILIGIPGALMPMNNQCTNKFGIMAYEISQAVRPDFSIFSTFYDLSSPDFFSLISQTTKYRLGFDIDCFNLANLAFDWRCMNNIEYEGVSYITLENSIVNIKKDEFKGLKIPTFNVMNNDDASNMSNYLINKLEDYSNTQVV